MAKARHPEPDVDLLVISRREDHDAWLRAIELLRAALSEYDDAHPPRRMDAVRERFVLTGRFDEELFRRAQRMQEAREAADYRARPPFSAGAHAAVEDAERFVAAVERMLGA